MAFSFEWKDGILLTVQHLELTPNSIRCFIHCLTKCAKRAFCYWTKKLTDWNKIHIADSRVFVSHPICRATFFSTAFGIIFNIRLAPTRLMHYQQSMVNSFGELKLFRDLKLHHQLLRNTLVLYCLLIGFLSIKYFLQTW